MRLHLVLIATGLSVLAGCSSQAPGAGHESDPASSGSIGTTAAALTTVTRSDAISNAELWVDAKLQYCQAPNGAHDDDTACSATCTRESNAEWDPYRSDCSGFVSWAWELPAPGRVTGELAPFDSTVSSTIDCTDMKAGDAANLTAGGHIVLFKSWVTPGTEAVFLEEPGCSAAEPYAHEFTSAVTCSGVNVDIAYEGESFTAIRYVNIADDPESPADAGVTEADASSGGTATDAGEPQRPASSTSTNDDVDAGNGNLQDANGTGNQGGCAIARSSERSSNAGAFFVVAALALISRRKKVAR